MFLLIEVAVFTVKHDRTVKKKNYAASGIPEYWIIIPKKGIMEVFRKIVDGKYSEKMVYSKKDTWIVESFALKVKGSDFLI